MRHVRALSLKSERESTRRASGVVMRPNEHAMIASCNFHEFVNRPCGLR
jgi:hypothetical protein